MFLLFDLMKGQKDKCTVQKLLHIWQRDMVARVGMCES